MKQHGLSSKPTDWTIIFQIYYRCDSRRDSYGQCHQPMTGHELMACTYHNICRCRPLLVGPPRTQVRVVWTVSYDYRGASNTLLWRPFHYSSDQHIFTKVYFQKRLRSVQWGPGRHGHDTMPMLKSNCHLCHLYVQNTRPKTLWQHECPWRHLPNEMPTRVSPRP